MTEQTKLMLSADELALVQDKAVILTKRGVIEKAATLFSSLVPAISSIFDEFLRRHDIRVNALPKIAKGENYNSFPYVVMDHPALFEKENIFAVRTMFWWGNFITITLHLSGKYKEMFAGKILTGNAADLFIAAGREEWQHHFEKDNFVPTQSLSATQKQNIIQNLFIKAALKFDLKDWNDMPKLLTAGYEKLNGLLK